MQFKDRSDDLLMFLELLQNRKYCRDTLFEETVQVLGLRSTHSGSSTVFCHWL